MLWAGLACVRLRRHVVVVSRVIVEVYPPPSPGVWILLRMDVLVSSRLRRVYSTSRFCGELCFLVYCLQANFFVVINRAGKHCRRVIKTLLLLLSILCWYFQNYVAQWSNFCCLTCATVDVLGTFYDVHNHLRSSIPDQKRGLGKTEKNCHSINYPTAYY